MERETHSINYWNILGIIFITLKLCKVIDWSWLWVLAPLWGQLVLAIIIVLVLKIAEFINEGKSYRDNVLSNGNTIHWDCNTKQMYDSNGNVIEIED